MQYEPRHEWELKKKDKKDSGRLVKIHSYFFTASPETLAATESGAFSSSSS